MKLIIIGMLSLISMDNLFAQDSEKDNEMELALQLHMDAKIFHEEEIAKTAFLKIGEEYEYWLAYFWAAYINTQQVNAIGDKSQKQDQQNLLNEAQTHLDKAIHFMDKKDKGLLSDVGALRILIDQFYYRLETDEAEKGKILERIDRELKKSTLLNEQNPLLYVLIGTNMLNSPKFSQIVAGRALLKEADQLFKERDIKRSQSTHFNEEWLDLFWLEFSDQQLREKANS